MSVKLKAVHQLEFNTETESSQSMPVKLKAVHQLECATLKLKILKVCL